MAIWSTVVRCIDGALATAQEQLGHPVSVKALGITNQRETTILWSKSTGQPLHNAIVWLDNRTRCGSGLGVNVVGVVKGVLGCEHCV